MLNPTADLLGAAVAYALPAAVAMSPVHGALRIHKRLRDPRRIALTFDDGPQPRVLEQFLRVLQSHHARATFFVVGRDVREYPELIGELRAAGHEVGNHGFTHRNHLLRNPLAIRADIERGAHAVADVLGEWPKLYRPCYGVITAATRYGAWRARSTLVLWSRWGKDWQPHATPQSIARLATQKLRGGDIILLHDSDQYGTEGSWRKTLAALPYIIDRAREFGLEPGPVTAGDFR